MIKAIITIIFSFFVINIVFSQTTYILTAWNELYKFEEDSTTTFLTQIDPFIAYLKAKHEDVKILLNNERILMMLSTEMDFLDEPSFRLGDDFTDEKYYHGMSHHLNSMFFVLESLIGKESPLELEEKLALRVKKIF